MNKEYVILKLAQQAATVMTIPDSKGKVSSGLDTSNKNTASKQSNNTQTGVQKHSTNSFSKAFSDYANQANAKIGDIFEWNGKKYKFEYGNKSMNENFKPKQGGNTSNTQDSSLNQHTSSDTTVKTGPKTFADAFKEYSQKQGAQIGDIFDWNGKKYKFEYADKKMNDSFKPKTAPPAAEKTNDVVDVKNNNTGGTDKNPKINNKGFYSKISTKVKDLTPLDFSIPNSKKEKWPLEINKPFNIPFLKTTILQKAKNIQKENRHRLPPYTEGFEPIQDEERH